MNSSGIIFLILALVWWTCSISNFIAIGFGIAGLCLIFSDFRKGKKIRSQAKKLIHPHYPDPDKAVCQMAAL